MNVRHINVIMKQNAERSSVQIIKPKLIALMLRIFLSKLVPFVNGIKIVLKP